MSVASGPLPGIANELTPEFLLLACHGDLRCAVLCRLRRSAAPYLPRTVVMAPNVHHVRNKPTVRVPIPHPSAQDGLAG